MYLRTIYLDERRQIIELKMHYEGKVKALNDEISSWMKKLDPSSRDKKMDELRQIISEKENERQSYCDIISSFNYAVECMDYVKTTKDLMRREPISREVWEKDGYDK